ncbi:hypothetical protein ACPA9J_16665 [Pseudomonas aeruginosa]
MVDALERGRHGAFFKRVPVPVPAGLSRPVLPERRTLPEPAAADRQLRVLRLVAGGLPPAVRRGHRLQLLDRPAHRRRRRAHQGRATLADPRRGGRPLRARVLQVRQLRRRQPQRDHHLVRHCSRSC